MGTTNADAKGFYSFPVECRMTYNIRAEKEKYTTKEEIVTIGKENEKTELNIALESSECKVTVDDDLASASV